jgi:hypothetical protein
LRAEINTWDPTGQALIGDTPRDARPARKRWALWTMVAALIAAVAGLGGWYWRRRRGFGEN